MNITRIIQTITILPWILVHPVSADTLRISQIDSGDLLGSQSIHTWVSVLNHSGNPVRNLTVKNFTALESADNKKFTKVPIQKVKYLGNEKPGIDLLLLLDNSGSMYHRIDKQNPASARKIQIAKNAVADIIKSIRNPKDRISLVSYNSHYSTHGGFTNDHLKIIGMIPEIKQPGGYDHFSEIYAALVQAIQDTNESRGRKAIIILSDGKNRSWVKYLKKPHPVHGNRIFNYSQVLQSAQKQAVSIYAINFGVNQAWQDRRLQEIAIASGGAVFDANNQKELSRVYRTIVKQIKSEYLISYKASMIPADKRFLKIRYSRFNQRAQNTRFYFTSTVFGIPLTRLTPLLLYVFLAALLLLWLLSRFRFENKKHKPLLEVLNPGCADFVTRVLDLNKSKTIIGSGKNSDLTITGQMTRVTEDHATIVFDQKIDQYTLISDNAIKVNNRDVHTRILESGDVISVDGTTFVFDDGKIE